MEPDPTKLLQEVQALLLTETRQYGQQVSQINSLFTNFSNSLMSIKQQLINSAESSFNQKQRYIDQQISILSQICKVKENVIEPKIKQESNNIPTYRGTDCWQCQTCQRVFLCEDDAKSHACTNARAPPPAPNPPPISDSNVHASIANNTVPPSNQQQAIANGNNNPLINTDEEQELSENDEAVSDDNEYESASSEEEEIKHPSRRVARRRSMRAHHRYSSDTGEANIQEKRFKCTWPGCVKSYKRKNSLRDHKNIHLKRYQCAECGRCTSSKPALERHQLTHTAEKPFQCHVCNFKCKVKLTLDRHVLQNHSQEQRMSWNRRNAYARQRIRGRYNIDTLEGK